LTFFLHSSIYENYAGLDLFSLQCCSRIEREDSCPENAKSSGWSVFRFVPEQGEKNVLFPESDRGSIHAAVDYGNRFRGLNR
jgi:hypothetical protein